jgi:hypothetical protein
MTKLQLSKILFLFCCVGVVACQKSCTSMQKRYSGSRNYHIEQYSGGQLIQVYDFHGTLNDSENSDGYYFFKQDTLVEISGEVIIKSWK